MPAFDTPGPITGVIDVPGGQIRILAADRADTVVEVRPADESQDADVQAAAQTQIEFAGGQLSVRTPKSRLRSLFGRYPAIDVTVELPTGSRVEAEAFANVRTEGRLGESEFDTTGFVRIDQAGRLRVRTAAGDVTVGRCTGNADVATSSGKIRIGAVDGTAVVKTSNGDILLGEVTGDVRLNTANGDIVVEQAQGAVSAKTAFGSVRIGEVVRGSLDLRTNFGEVELGVREGTAAWLDVSSKYGTVRSDLEPIDPGETSKHAVEHAAETVEVTAYTGFGDIIIRRP